MTMRERLRVVRQRRFQVRRPRLRRPRPGRHWLPQLAALGLGLLLVPAFPPIGLWWLAPVSVAGFTLAARDAAAQRTARGLPRGAGAAAWTGFWFGLGFCVPAFYWLTTIGTDAWILLSIVEALYFIPLGAATALTGRLPGAAFWQAAAWVGEEAARDRWPLGGFSWGRLAFSQTDTVFTKLAALGGAPLVTFATALAGTVLASFALTGYQAARRRGDRAGDRADRGRVSRAAIAAAAGWVVLAVGLPATGWLVPIQTTAGKPVQLVAIQGNVPRSGLDWFGQASSVLNNHVAVTEQYAAEVAAGKAPQPAAVFWPEDSDDIDPYTDAFAAQEITQAAQAVHTQILIGTVVTVNATQDKNEGVVWDPKTGPGAVYVKQHLVPFGEYIPFRPLVTKFFSEESLVPVDDIPGSAPGVLTVGGVKIADVICFEVAFDDIVRDSVRGGGGVLVVQTNNADYGHTWQPAQQLAISQLRAVESGRPVMIAATSGISGYITPDGVIHQQTGQFTPAVVAADVTPRTGFTLADEVGAWPEIALAFTALAASIAAVYLGRRTAMRERRTPSVSLAAAAALPGQSSEPEAAPVAAPAALPAPVAVGRAGPVAPGQSAEQPPQTARKAHT
jgi:apolipoprotein N-acyltransferase